MYHSPSHGSDPSDRSRPKPPDVLALLLIALLMGLLSGCGRKQEPDAAAGHAATLSAPVWVGTGRTTLQERAALEEVMGTVAARSKPIVAAQIAGTITRLHADLGQRVRKGDLLAEIEAREADARLSAAQAALEPAEHDLRRMEQLVGAGTVSRQNYEAAKSKAQAAAAAVTEAQAAVAYKRVTAPADGIVRVRRVDAGDLASPGRPLFELEDDSTLRFEAHVPESLTRYLHPALRVPVQIESAGQTVEASLSEVTPSADPVSRTFLARFDLPPTSGVMSGQFGRTSLPVGPSSRLNVPVSAVVSRGQMDIVFVVQESKAQLRLVRTGKSGDGQVQILSGLMPGEEIVTSGAARLQDGALLRVNTTP